MATDSSTLTLRELLLADVERHPNSASSWLQCGLYLFTWHEDKEEARKCFEKALALDPKLARARRALSINVEEWPLALSLTTLDLGNNQLTSLPPEIVQLTGLTSLNLSNNQLTSLPPEIVQLTGLTSLNLSGNQLTSLPPEIVQLTGLTSLNLSSNRLTSLPPEIVQLTGLTSLNLGSNQLTSLPPEIVQLTGLTSLSLGYSDLTSLPPEIGQLSNLTTLLLMNNQLTSLPPEIGQLSNLTTLLLMNNQLTSLPPEIGQLSNLTDLYLSGATLMSLPPEIGQLSSLSSLHLGIDSFSRRSNQLTSLPPEIGQLSNLTGLNLEGNHLTSLPLEIVQLTGLTSLDLSSNRLTSLPPKIARLNSLTSLYLRDNQLTSLPPEIANLKQLQFFDLTGNPLPIPPEVLQRIKDPPAIIDYYLQYLALPRKALNEAKVLLVGQGGVGKSSLIRRLIDNRFNAAERKTEGVDIRHWHLPIGEDSICLNVWDFGGQEIMHATHQFFLTKRSLYLLVADNRTEEEESRLEYWLKIIQSFGGDSPVIIVGNKADQHPMALDQRALRSKYDNIRAFVATSCQTGQGLDELEATLRQEIARLPHVRDQLIAPWFDVKARLEEMDEDYLPHERYLELCQTEEVRDEISQRTLLGFLHDLGIVLSFQDDLRLQETNILNPEWVTRGVYSILNADAIAQSYGVLEVSMLSQILDSRRYPRSKQMFIIDMMRKFELCYDFEGQADRFLVPDLLPKERPDVGNWDGALAFQYHYSVLPSSIISRFIVRLNHLIYERILWRSGVVLEEGRSKALVVSDREEKLIYIKISGPPTGRRSLLKVVRTELEAIHKTIPGLEVEAAVPLPEQPEIVVSYGHLLTLEELGESAFIPVGYNKRVSVRELLNGVDIDPERERPFQLPAQKEQKERRGMPPYLKNRLYSALISTGHFESDRELKFLFVDERIYPWQAQLESGSSAEQRARGIVALLYDKDNAIGQGALGLLLEVLSEQASPGTGLKRDLAALAEELRALGY